MSNGSGSYNRVDVFDQVNGNGLTYQNPPTPPPGVMMSPIRKRAQSTMRSMFGKRSTSDPYFQNNGTQESVQTEEIPLDDFDTNQRNMARVSFDNHKRVASLYQ